MRQQKRWANGDRKHKCTEYHGRRDCQNKTGNTETERESGTISGVSAPASLILYIEALCLNGCWKAVLPKICLSGNPIFFSFFLIWQGESACREAFGACEHLGRRAVAPLLELGCRFLHSASHTCSTFDVGVLTHVPPPPPLLLYIWNIKLARVLSPTTATSLSPATPGCEGSLWLRWSLKVNYLFFFFLNPFIKTKL